MNSKKLKIISLALLIVFVLTGSVFAANSEKIKIYYSNLKMYINGSILNTDLKPFIVDGTTYVPLRVIGEALEAKVEWRGETNSIHITKQVDTQKMQRLQTEVNRLRSELNKKQQELANLRHSVLNYINKEEENEFSIDDLEDELNDDYEELEDVEVDDIKLDGDEDDVEVEIEIELDDYKDDWSDLRNKDIEDWIEDMVDDIQSEIDDDLQVEGIIINTDDDDETLVEFEKDGDDDLEIDYEDEDYRDPDEHLNDIEDEMEGNTFYIDVYRFKIDYVNYDNDDIIVRVVCEDTDLDEDEWDDIDEDDIEDDVIDICEDIAEEFEGEGDVDPETVEINIYTYEDNKLDEYEYDVEDEDLN